MALIQPRIFKDKKYLPRNTVLIDIFENAIKELFAIQYPQYQSQPKEDYSREFKKFIAGNRKNDIWIYYPWAKKAIHTPNEELYFVLRTARNRNIITSQEQTNYRNICVGIAGLSVGSTILHALTISGGPKNLKIADFDTIEISNLNRIRATLLDVNENKAEVAAKNVWEIDPFAKIDIWDKGIKEDTLKNFALHKPKLDFFIDEMDNLPLKIQARRVCRKEKIPVIMATDNGDSVSVDVERFDLEPKRQFFHGIIPNVEKLSLGKLGKKEWISLATKIVNPVSIPERMKDSIEEIGKTISGIPQLGTTANTAGSAVAYAVRRMANQQNMPSGRYTIDFNEIFAS
jgi:molybdopterin/thiamine biosynthesis adenylyltransferase